MALSMVSAPLALCSLSGVPGPTRLTVAPGPTAPWTGTINSARPAQPFLEGEDGRKQSGMLPTLEGTQMVGHGDCRAPAEALAVADHILHIPAPDYPQLWSPTVGNGDPEEKDCLFENHSEVGPLPGTHPKGSEQGLNVPLSLRRSWDSLNEEAVTTDVLNVYFREEGPTHSTPGVGSGNAPEDPHAHNGDADGVVDAEVAEALAALEAATAGEDGDDAY